LVTGQERFSRKIGKFLEFFHAEPQLVWMGRKKKKF
jgi:hypothetical protein